MPCVLIDRFADERFDQIGVENQSAMRTLIDHVVSFGHERIGFIAGQPGLATTRERIEAFRAALAANGLAVVADYISPENVNTASATASTHAILSLAVAADGIGDRQQHDDDRGGAGDPRKGPGRSRGIFRSSASTISNGPIASSRA